MPVFLTTYIVCASPQPTIHTYIHTIIYIIYIYIYYIYILYIYYIYLKEKLHNSQLGVSRCLRSSGEYKIIIRIIKFINVTLLMYQS